MERRVINTEFTAEDAGIENNLRPASLDEYIGQEKIKQNLRVFIEAFGSLPVLRTSGTWKDYTCGNYCI